MGVRTLYTTGDVAREAGVDKTTASNWYRRGHAPEPDFITTSGVPLWLSLWSKDYADESEDAVEDTYRRLGVLPTD